MSDDRDGDQLDLLSTSSVLSKTSGVWMTSKTHPIPVGWVRVPGPGRLGLTYAPGRRDRSRYTGSRWERDLVEDLTRLREVHGANVLVSLLEEAELSEIASSDLEAEARRLGLEVVRLPVPDQGVPPDREELKQTVETISKRLNDGKVVVVVSRGGHGRTGLLAACLLVFYGISPEAAVEKLRKDRGPHCPNEGRQVGFIYEFARHVDWFDEDTKQSRDGSDRPSERTLRGYRVMPNEERTLPGMGESEGPPASGDSFEIDISVSGLESLEEAKDHDGEPETAAEQSGARPALVLDLTGEGFSDGQTERPAEVKIPPLAEPEAVRETLASPAPRLRRLTPRQALHAGVVLGAAIGDAIGHPTEFIRSFDAIRQKYGPSGVKGYELYWERDGKRFAPYTDDTQMAEAVLRALLASRDEEDDLDAAMQRMGRGFVDWADRPQGGHRAPGNACLAGCRAISRGAHWSEAGGETAGGCGSVMRAYPFGLLFSDDVARAERWSVAHSKLTHRDPIALAACAAMAVGTALVAHGDRIDVVLSEMVAAACRYSPRTAKMMAEALEEADNGTGPEKTLARLEGWAAHEAIAAAVYVVARHPDDPRAAILEAANTPGDSDSLATLAGALVGGRAGAQALPEEWVRDLERADDLIALALEI